MSITPAQLLPVPSNPVDFAISSGYVLTLTGSTTPTSFPYTGGTSVWPYTYVSTTGQLQLSLNGIQQLGINQGTAIVSTNGVNYVLDNEPVTIGSGSSFNPGTYPGQILGYTVTSGDPYKLNPEASFPMTPSWPIQFKCCSSPAPSTCTLPTREIT